MARLRNSLWTEVVLNLSLLTVLTIALNAVLMGQVVQGREASLRRALAAELSRDLALRVGLHLERAGATSLRAADAWMGGLKDAALPDGEPVFAVVAGTDLRPLATMGPWPAPLAPEELSAAEVDALRRQWLVDATDARAALAGGRTERGEWQPRPSLFFGRSWAAASSPIVTPGGQAIGVVRVLAPVGNPLFGPMDRRSLPVLLASMFLGGGIMGAFGLFLFRRRILDPIQQIARHTNEVAQGRFEHRIADDAADELGELARAFNRMTSRLETYRRANESQVTELKTINAELSEVRDDLIFAEKMATVGRLAAGVAHEVGNPLASVIGFVELIQGSPEDRELAADLLPRIRAELDRINKIIRDLLNYSRPSGDTQNELVPISAEPVNLAAVVERAASLVGVQKRFADVAVRVALPDDLPVLHLHAGRLEQVVLNLLVNAAEAMGGSGAIDVTFVGVDDGMLTLSVRDEGPGIDPRAGSNIFEPFYTTKEVGQGTGLGLAVSLRLVERMGGKLRHLRDLPGGACFHLSLPVVP